MSGICWKVMLRGTFHPYGKFRTRKFFYRFWNRTFLSFYCSQRIFQEQSGSANFI